MNIYKYDGLICTDVEVTFEGKTKILKNVVIDTGAVQSIMNSLAVEEMGISPEFVDEISTTVGIGGAMNFFVRKVEGFKFGEVAIKDIELDFGEIDPKGELMGLIGLDLLEKYRALIDVELPAVTRKAT